MENKITKEDTIAEVVQQYPMIVPILMNNGLHCIGCHIAQVESLEQGFKTHGVDETKIDEIIQEMNKKINEPIQIITITPEASKKIQEHMDNDNKKEHYVKVNVTQDVRENVYDITFEKEKTEDQELIEEQGLKVLIEKDDKYVIKGCIIRYENDRFVISNSNNPNL